MSGGTASTRNTAAVQVLTWTRLGRNVVLTTIDTSSTDTLLVEDEENQSREKEM